MKKFGSEWGSIKTFWRKVFVSQCRKIPWGNPLLLHFFPVAKIFGWEGEYQDFTSKILCLTVRRIFLGEFFTVALFSGGEKFWIGGGVSRFSVENFVSHRAETFRRGDLYCCINFGYGKSLDQSGGVAIFSVEIFSSHSAENFRR